MMNVPAGPVVQPAAAEPVSRGVRPTGDRAWLVEHYVERGLTLAQMGRLAGVSESRMSQVLRRHGIATRPAGWPGAGRRPFRVGRLNDAEWLRREYLQHRRSQAEIAGELEVSTALVGRAMRRHGVPSRSGGGGPASPVAVLADAVLLRELRLGRGLSVVAIAAQVGSSTASVYRALHTHGIGPSRR